MKNFYLIADHPVALCAEASLCALLTNYKPFATEETADVAFTLTVKTGSHSLPDSFCEDCRQEEEGSEIICGQQDGLPSFVFCLNGLMQGRLCCNPSYTEATLLLCGPQQKYAVDNAMMVLYALSTARKGTVLFHASVVSKDGAAYMFLGPSGTGKSTHSALWLKHIPQTELVNDDNPVVRVFDDGRAVVYGSPWSGKTPCYRQLHFPLAGIVRLSQAPFNRIQPLRGIEAYAVLTTSISGKRWERAIADGLHETENALAQLVPVWHLECLPDREAALCSFSTITRHASL